MPQNEDSTNSWSMSEIWIVQQKWPELVKYIYIYIVILPSSWWGSGAAMATLRPSSWNPRSFQWVSIHVNEQVTTPQNLAFAMQQNVEGLFISFSYLLHLGNLFPCIQYTSIETLECVQCVHVGSPVKKEFRRIEARQTARPSGSSDKKHGCGSPNLEILMEKNSCERVGDIPLPCYMNVCLPEGMLSSTLYIDWLLRSKHVPGFCVWHLEENTLQPKWNSLGVPILGNFHMYIYIYCDLLWFIEIYAEIFGVYVYIYILYPYVPTFERHLPHSGQRQVALWIGSIDGFWQRTCSNSGKWCGEAGWNTWAMIC